MSKIKFTNQWDEMCPIFRDIDNYKTYEQIGTGVLLNISDDIYLLTASHVIDFIYENNNKLFIPTIDGFGVIEGELFHNPLIYGDKYRNPQEYRKEDKIDFSYYKLDSNTVSRLSKNYKPLKENQIDLASDFSLNPLFEDRLQSLQNTRASHVKRMIKEVKEKDFSDEEIDYMDDERIETIIIFAGYPLSKATYRNGQFSSELLYNWAIALDKKKYELNNYDISKNILAQFGKKGVQNSDLIDINPISPYGISGGGIYKIVRTKKGFDRKLIGIGHQYIDKEHLFVGTNINHCLSLIKDNQIMPYEVHQRLNSMCEMLWEMDKDEILEDGLD